MASDYINEHDGSLKLRCGEAALETQNFQQQPEY